MRHFPQDPAALRGTIWRGQDPRRRGGSGPERTSNSRVPSLFYFAGAIVTLFALLHWVRRRAEFMRGESAEREQRAMEELLAAGVGASAADPVAAAAGHASDPAFSASAEPVDTSRLAPVSTAANAPELAAAGMDPIEELISHIVAEPAQTKQPAAVPERPRLRRWAMPLSVRYPSEADSIA